LPRDCSTARVPGPESRIPADGGHGDGLYLAAALALTWPLAGGLARDIPWDLGDSVLNCWILQWGADHWLRFLGGDFGAFRGYFNANIFYSEPLTLAYSEHLTAQVLQILPVYALTGNIVLSYNLLFLSTFVLSGLGTFLLVRELTGSARAGFVAGLLYAFAPYRIGSLAHAGNVVAVDAVRAVRSQALLRDAPGPAPRGRALALVAQNWSCGYFLMYFAPFVAAYVIYEIGDRGLWRDVRVWASLGARRSRRGRDGAAPASLPGTARAWLRSEAARRGRALLSRRLQLPHGTRRAVVLGSIMRAFVKPEGELFPSLMPVLLAIVGVAAHARVAWAVTRSRGADPDAPAWRRAVIYAAAVVLAWQVASLLVILAHAGFDWRLGPVSIRVHSTARALRSALLAAAVLAIVSRRARAFLRGCPVGPGVLRRGAGGRVLAVARPDHHVQGRARGGRRFVLVVLPIRAGVRRPPRAGPHGDGLRACARGRRRLRRARNRALAPAVRSRAGCRRSPVPGGSIAGAHQDERHVECRGLKTPPVPFCPPAARQPSTRRARAALARGARRIPLRRGAVRAALHGLLASPGGPC